MWGGADSECFFEWSWIAFSLDSFIVAAFVFVSGYLFSYQCRCGAKREITLFARVKAKRLLLPYFIFGIPFFFLYRFDCDTFDFQNWFFSTWPLGHLWFLPMLFWVYLCLWLISEWEISSNKRKVIILIFTSLLSMNPWSRNMPLSIIGLCELSYYLFYGYLGYLLYEKRTWFIKHISFCKVLLLWICFLILLLLYKNILIPRAESGVIISKLICLPVKQLVACVGILSVYLPCLCFYKHDISVNLAQNLGKYCFAVYIVHYFILLYLYDNQIGVEQIGFRRYPWIIGTLAVSVLSLSVAYILKHIRPLSKII